MYFRRRLPHFHPAAGTGFLFITWRLAGSLPRTRAGVASQPVDHQRSAGRAFVVADREVDQAAFGPTWLSNVRVAEAVRDALLHGEASRHWYELSAWVVMPNHVHILIRPHATTSAITRWLKGSTARQANFILHRTGRPFWQDESYDHWVRHEPEWNRIARYIEHNPVAAGFVATPEEWPWSSAAKAGPAAAGESACPTTDPT
jgi:putative DNA methylase